MDDKRPASVLLVDDDEDYYFLMREAFAQAGLAAELEWAKDGEELFEHLASSRSPGSGPKSRVILLDLNMPRMNGYQALERIKADKTLCQIPVVILTTSRSENDVNRSYRMGASSFISKPNNFSILVEFAKIFHRYWFDTARLPANSS